VRRPTVYISYGYRYRHTRTRTHRLTHTHTRTHLYLYLYRYLFWLLYGRDRCNAVLDAQPDTRAILSRTHTRTDVVVCMQIDAHTFARTNARARTREATRSYAYTTNDGRTHSAGRTRKHACTTRSRAQVGMDARCAYVLGYLRMRMHAHARTHARARMPRRAHEPQSDKRTQFHTRRRSHACWRAQSHARAVQPDECCFTHARALGWQLDTHSHVHTHAYAHHTHAPSRLHAPAGARCGGCASALLPQGHAAP
jgi:hypothetical protein